MTAPRKIRTYKFRVHVNRHKVRSGAGDIWIIHYRNQCIPARGIRLEVPIETVYKSTGPQPRAYLAGEGVVVDTGNREYVIVDGTHEKFVDVFAHGRAVCIVGVAGIPEQLKDFA